MEPDYLKRCFGNCLAQGLAEVAKVQPSDPIEYLAHWLYHYRETTKAKEEVCICAGSAWGGLSSFPRVTGSPMPDSGAVLGSFSVYSAYKGSLGPDILEAHRAWGRLKKESNSQE